MRIETTTQCVFEMVPWLYRAYLAGALGAACVMAAECLRVIGLNSKRTWTILDEILRLVEQSDSEATSQLLNKLPANSPEAGLRAPVSGARHDRATFLKLLPGADARFRFVIDRLSLLQSGVSKLVVLTLLVSLAFAANSIFSLYLGMSAEKQLTMWVVYTALAETFHLLYEGLLVLVILFMCHSYLLIRITRRKSFWEFFFSRAREIGI